MFVGANNSVPVALTASGVVIAGVAGKRIRVFGAAVVSLLATGIKFQSAANDITGVLSLAANGGVVWTNGTAPWFQCNIGEALNINMSVATTLGGVVTYDLA
jgi:hypothetical protein